MNEEIESLVAIIEAQKKQIATPYQDAIEHWCDYKTFWVMGEALWRVLAPMQNRRFVPLAEINVGEAVYRMAVDKAYGTETAATPLPQAPAVGHFERYINNLRGKHNTEVGLEDAEHTKEDVEKVWASIVNPPSLNQENGDNDTPTVDLDEERRRRGKAFGLVVGRVQSGKTRNYTGLLLKAFDEGWNTIIVLTSDRTTLADQTLDRIQKECRDVDLPIQPIDFGNQDSARMAWVPGGKYVGIAQKNVIHLRNLEQWVDRISAEGSLPRVKLLLLDDESDNATPDTQQSSSYVLMDSDIESIARNFPSRGDKATECVKDWICGLGQLDIVGRAIEIGIANDEASANEIVDEVRRAIAQSPSQAAVINLLRERDGNVCKILGIDEEKEVEPGRFMWLNEMVIEKMNHRRGRRHPFDNTRILQSLVQYVFEIRVDRSRINHLVATIFSDGGRCDGSDRYQFGKMAYVCYTATPYANLLNEDPRRDPLAPDFIYPMHTSRHYIGMMRMFGEPQRSHDDEPKMSAVRKIDDGEIGIIRAIQDGVLGSGHDDLTVSETGELIVSWDEEADDGTIQRVTKEWGSLKDAVAWLFCSAAVRRLNRLRNRPYSREKPDRWTTMLLNIGIDQELHGDLKDKVCSRYLRWVTEHQEAFQEVCRVIWEAGRLKLDFGAADFLRACIGYGEVADYPSWTEIDEHVRWFLQHIGSRVHCEIANGSLEGRRGMGRYRDDDEEYARDSEDHIWILCGGYTMSRGLTLDGLVVSYVDRMCKSTAVDTLIQIGRWFGYREGYELLPRVWLSGDTIEEFKKMAFSENCLHRDLKHNFDLGFSPKSGDHYTRVIKFSRQLSGRSAAETVVGEVDGAFDVFNVFLADSRHDVLGCVREFTIDGLGLDNQMPRPIEDYAAQGNINHRYHTYPYWRGVGSDQIERFLGKYVDFAPEEEQVSINALLSEIQNVPQKWDVVFSDATPRDQERNGRFQVADGLSLGMSNTPCTSSENGRRVEFGKFSGDNIAFFSGVKTAAIVHGEIDLCKDAMSKKTGLPLPLGWDKNRVEALFRERESNGYREELPTEIRAALLGSKTRMTSNEYRSAVFKHVDKPDPDYDGANPILQIALVRPPANEGIEDVETPFAAVSFFWPGHNDSRYSYVAAGAVAGSMDDGSFATADELRIKIGECLAKYGFLKRKTLRKMIVDRFGENLLDDEKLNIALGDGRTRYAAINPDLGDSLECHIVKSTIYSKSWLAKWNVPNASAVQCVCHQIENEALSVLMRNGGFAECDASLWRWMDKDERYQYHLECIYGELDDLFLAMEGKGWLSSFHIGKRGGDDREGWVIDKSVLWRIGEANLEGLCDRKKDLVDELKEVQERDDDACVRDMVSRFYDSNPSKSDDEEETI